VSGPPKNPWETVGGKVRQGLDVEHGASRSSPLPEFTSTATRCSKSTSNVSISTWRSMASRPIARRLSRWHSARGDVSRLDVRGPELRTKSARPGVEHSQKARFPHLRRAVNAHFLQGAETLDEVQSLERAQQRQPASHVACGTRGLRGVRGGGCSTGKNEIASSLGASAGGEIISTLEWGGTESGWACGT